MRTTGENTSQISDEDYQGGICPSCRLAVNKDTGRLTWCMGGNDIWRTRIRLMLLIPAVILPIAIVIIAISKSTVIGKLSMRSGQSDNDASTTNLRSQQTEPYSPAVQSELEPSDIGNRVLHPDADNSFIPAESLVPSQNLRRYKKNNYQGEGRVRSEALPLWNQEKVAVDEARDSEPLQEVQVKFLKV